MKLIEYLDSNGGSPFAEWFSGLNSAAATKISVALLRMESGDLSNAKSVGEGVLEYRIDWGPGYRIYLCLRGKQLILLLGGGDKKRQGRDILLAKERLRALKTRKIGDRDGDNS